MGVVFLLVGIGGDIPGISTGYDTMRFIGHHSHAMLRGVFQVSVLHNVVHLLYGGIGVALTGSATRARHYLLWGWVVHLGLWIDGLLSGQDSAAGFVPLNPADDWLHLFLGVTMVGLSSRPSGPHRTDTRPAH
jgi:hypothetical protein